MQSISVQELNNLVGTVSVVDVREPGEYMSGHVPGAQSMPLATVPVRMNELDRSQTHYVICQAGGRSAQACQFLKAQGYDVVNVEGGTGDWIYAGFTATTGMDA